MAQKKYTEAVNLYGQAIELDGLNAVYYANRAAANSQLGNHESAIKDSRKAIEINPNYSKAYSRLGHALFSNKEYKEAEKAYEKAAEFEPNNANIKAALATCKSHTGNSSSVTATENPTPRSAPGAGAGGFPGMGGMGGMPGLGGMDFGSLLSNPALMNMAQQMMSNPQMAQMAQQMMSSPDPMAALQNNPEMADMARNMMQGDGSGNNPLADLMNNPDIANMAKQFMGGRGGNNPGNN
jgi:small glutamine-rich tetratricopeptide repeat-containing protein alpha